MRIEDSRANRIKEYLIMELGDKILVDNIFHTIKLYHHPQEDEVLVTWESDWINKNQLNPWFAKIIIKGQDLKRVYIDCKLEYQVSDTKMARSVLDTNIKIGTIVEYVEGGNSKRTMQYYGLITKFGLYRLGDVEDNSTLPNFLKLYDVDILEQITEEHELMLT